MRTKSSVPHSSPARLALTTLMTISLLLLALTSQFSSAQVQPKNERVTKNERPAASQQAECAQQCQSCPQPTRQTIYAPVFDLPEASGSEIILNSRSPHVMDITPTFYTAEGVGIVGETFQLQPAEIRTVNVQSMLPAEHQGRQQRWGGISFSFVGSPLEMWAQLRLLGVGKGGGSVDVLFAVQRDKRSDVREAVWLMPPHSIAILALGNISNAAETATIQFSNGETKEVQINPFATELVYYRPELQDYRDDSQANDRMSGTRAEAVKVLSSGATPGSLISAGLVTSAKGSFTSSIRFYDTPNAAQPNLFATNFRLKHVEPHLVLKNTGTSPVTAHPRFRPLDAEKGSPVELPPVDLAPGEVAEVDLSSLVAEAGSRSDLAAASVQVVNEGAKGSLIGALNGIDTVTGLTYDVPLRDSGPMRNSTGAYPWRVDKDFSTVVSITNPNDNPSEFIMQFNYAGGPYVFDPRKLAAGETVTFDLRKIRDEQLPDNQGHVLPRTVTSGQVRWSIHGANSARLIGRSEMLSASKHISSSFSCACDCPSGPGPIWIEPGAMEGPINTVMDFNGKEIDYDCVGNQIGPFSPGGNWSIGDYSIATMSYTQAGDAEVTGIDAGNTFVALDVPFERYTFDGLNCLDMGPSSTGTSNPVTIVKVLLRLRTIGTVSTDDAGRSTYSSLLGTTDLGTFLSSGSGNRIWRVKGVEIVGIVTPSDYTGTITLRRTIIESRSYRDNNPTPTQTITGQDDTSDPSLRDDDPQSGGSGGAVYDLDAPGIGLTSGAAVGTITRRRVNYLQFAVIGNSIFSASNNLLWFARESVIKTSNGDQLLNDISGDNDAGTGATNLTLNLQ